jgi:hypothetical protein
MITFKTRIIAHSLLLICLANLFACENEATPDQLELTNKSTTISESTPSSRNSIFAKPRIINTTDLGADPDDEQSMVRQLVQANEFDIEGLIVSTGCWKKSQSDTKMLDSLLQAYGKALPNLRVHDRDFPSLEYLQSVSVMGQTGYGMSDVGEGKDSPGSELIINAVDREDPRPLWVTCWGGCNTIAQAVWKVQNTRSSEELEKFLSKLRVYDVLGQDDAGTWLAKNFPSLFYIRTKAVYGWQFDKKDPWWEQNVQSHGALGAVFPSGKWAMEGDTPAFLYLMPNGLSDPEQVSQGNWGGRFSSEKQAGIRGMSCMKGEDEVYDPYFVYADDPGDLNAASRWKQGYDNDFEARMDWSISPNYEDANHHPHALLNSDASKSVLTFKAKPGDNVQLSAEGSSDPDGDPLNFEWMYYQSASSYKGKLSLVGASQSSLSVNIPQDTAGKLIHIVLTVKDQGEPSLHSYRRAIIKVE